MALTRTKFLRIMKISAALGLVALIGGFAAYRSLPYARGPHITVFSPANGVTISSTTVEIVGRAERINSLYINNDVHSIDEAGNFKKTLIVFPGVNAIMLKATDQFGRSLSQNIYVVGAVELPKQAVSLPATATVRATSTATTTP